MRICVQRRWNLSLIPIRCSLSFECTFMVWIETRSVEACPVLAGWPLSKLCGQWSPCKPVKRLYRSRVPNHNEMRSESCAYSLFMPRERRLAAFFQRQLVSQRQPLCLSLGCTVDGCEGAETAVSVATRQDLQRRSSRNVRETRPEGPDSVLVCAQNLLAFVRPFVGVKCFFLPIYRLGFLSGVFQRGNSRLYVYIPL